MTLLKKNITELTCSQLPWIHQDDASDADIMLVSLPINEQCSHHVETTG